MSYLIDLFRTRYRELPRTQRVKVYIHSMIAGYRWSLSNNTGHDFPAGFTFYLGCVNAFAIVKTDLQKYNNNSRFNSRTKVIAKRLTIAAAAAQGFDSFKNFNPFNWSFPLINCPAKWANQILNGVTMSNPTQLSGNLDPAVMERLTMHLAELEQSLTTNDPMMPQHLRNIHALVLSYPESVHLLEERDAVGLIIKGLQKHTSVEIVKVTAAKPRGPKAAKVSASDL